MLSQRLPFDLFDDENFASTVKTVTVCPVCLKCFAEREEMKDHKLAEHAIDAKVNIIFCLITTFVIF